MVFEEYLKRKREVIDKYLDFLLPSEESLPRLLHRAMRYSIFAGGKRFRPILLIAVGETLGVEEEYLIEPACAIECIHTYSLIHDDLPCIDNDDYRRGKLTNHKVFGEAIAVLAGDALLTIAFQILSKSRIVEENPRIGMKIIQCISQAAGTCGMLGGQVLDISYEDKEVTDEEILEMDFMKTAQLIKASVMVAAYIAEADAGTEIKLGRYGEKLGIAFQIADDLLDVQGSEEQVGKKVRKDILAKKATLCASLGCDAAREKAESLIKEAINEIKSIDKFLFLEGFANYVLNRVK